MMKIQKHPFLRSHLDEVQRIFFASFEDNIRVDLNTAKSLVATRLDATQGNEHYLVIDISNVREVTFEAREFLLRPEGGLKNIIAAAFIVNNPVAALIGNVFIKTEKGFPSRVFMDLAGALSWIQSIIKTETTC